MTNTTPLSLYLHIPWCVRKCPYCDFNSHQSDSFDQDAYIDCLLLDLKHDLAHYQITRPIHSIFIGGGTPSLFSAKNIAYLLNTASELCDFEKNIEITMEANPGTIEYDNFAAYREAGVNRLSLGVQSFEPEKLTLLGRIHSGEEAIAAIETVKIAGFDNFNIDLMFGLPKQSIDQGLADLQQAIDLAPTHISWYQLTLEPNTVFYKKPPRLPNEDLIADLHDAGQQLLASNGFQQYEISAYAKNNQLCQHNINYWKFGDYLGIGAGAHGKISLADNTVKRSRKIKQPDSYMARKQQGNFCAAENIITGDELPFEYMLNRLRLNQIIELSELPSNIQLHSTDPTSPLNLAVAKGLLRIDKDTIQKTELGQRFLNDLLTLFI